MTYFTDSAFERMMVQKPHVRREGNPPAPPRGSPHDARTVKNGDARQAAYCDLIILPKKKEAEPCGL